LFGAIVANRPDGEALIRGAGRANRIVDALSAKNTQGDYDIY